MSVKIFLLAFGLMLFLEGAAYALFPEKMREMMQKLSQTPAQYIRFFGISASVFGFLILAVLSGY